MFNSTFMGHKGYDKTDSLVIEYQEMSDRKHQFNDSIAESRLIEIRKIWENENITDGLIEPIPETDEDKEFLVIQFCKIYNSTYETELSFDEYRSKFNQEVQNKLDPKEYAENELKVIKESLDKNFNVDINHRNGKTLRDLVYYMTNNNFKIDYLFFYNEYHLRYNFRDIILILSKIVYAVQYQRFLEIWLKNYKEVDKSLIANHSNHSATSLEAEEDFVKLFLDSFAGKEIKDIKQIADYFERESLKFIKKNSDATFTSKQRDLMLGEFLEKVEYAKKEIDKPFLRYEKMHLDRIYEAESKGIDTTNFVVPDLSKTKLQMFEIYRPYKGELYYWEVQCVYQGFEIFKLQHEIDTYVPAPNPTKQQTGFKLGYSKDQLKALHKALIDKNFLDNKTKDTHFINAFNGEGLTNFEKLKWIDISIKRKEINAQTLYEFLYLLKMPNETYKTDANEKDNFYRKIERIFEPIPNLTEKNPSKVEGNTVRKKELQNIILNLNLI